MSWLRGGLSTGTCAAAAAKAATLLLAGGTPCNVVDLALPDGTRVNVPIAWTRRLPPCAEAAVRKDAGDDPDVTHGAEVLAAVTWTDDSEVRFRGGTGVGTVTKPGLSVAPGEPAINPVPRRMIREAIREVTPLGVEVVVSIPGGEELAAKTFNPRLGIVGGLSILGTTGRVRPFSAAAMQEALRCAVGIARAAGVTSPVMVPGNIGARAARAQFRLSTEQVIETANAWGFMLDAIAEASFPLVLVVGHPGKLAKLVDGEWDTHSSRSRSALPCVTRVAESILSKVSRSSSGKQELDVSQAGVTQAALQASTVEGLFERLNDAQREVVGRALSESIVRAIEDRIHRPVAAVLVNMRGERLGTAGDLTPWT